MTQTPLHNKTDLSYINTLKDLRKEIVKVKATVRLQEKEMAEQMKKMPEIVSVAAVRAAIPLIAKRGVPVRIFNLITTSIGLFISLRRQKKGVQAVISQVKELILYSVLGKLIRIYQQKRNRGKLTAVRK
jgi:hypothetical protein